MSIKDAEITVRLNLKGEVLELTLPDGTRSSEVIYDLNVEEIQNIDVITSCPLTLWVFRHRDSGAIYIGQHMPSCRIVGASIKG